MTEPSDKTKKFLKGASDDRTKTIRGSVEAGAWTVQGPTGKPLEVRTGADVWTAIESGATGEVGFMGPDGKLRTIDLGTLAEKMPKEAIQRLKLAQGQQATRALDENLFGKLMDMEEEKGTFHRIMESAKASIPFNEPGSLQEDAQQEAGAAGQPIATMVGAGITTLGLTAVPGGAAVKAAQGAKWASLAAKGTLLGAEAATFEQALAQQENREFNPEAAALDFAIGAGAGLLAKIVRKGSRSASNFAQARKAEKTRNLSLSSNMGQAKKVTMANAMKGKVVKEDIGAASEVLRQAGDVDGLAHAEYVAKFSDQIDDLPARVRASSKGIKQQVEGLGTMLEETQAAWRKNIGKVDATTDVNMAQVTATLARKAEALGVGAPPSSREVFVKMERDLMHAAKQYQARGLNLAELQESIHEVSTKYFPQINSGKNAVAKDFLEELRQAKRNPEYFGNAAHQRSAADSALANWKESSKKISRLVGSEAKMKKLLRGGDPAELMQVSMEVENLLGYVEDLHKNNVPGFAGGVYTKHKAQLQNLRKTLQAAEGSMEAPGPMRLFRSLSAVDTAVGRIRVTAAAPPAANPMLDMAMGAMAGGLPGAVAGGLAGRFVKQAAIKASSEAAIIIDKGVTKVAKAFESQLSRSAAFRTLGASSRLFQDSKTKRKDYEEVAMALEDAAGNPDYLVTEMTSAVDGLEEFEGDAAAQAANAIFYLANELPKTSSPNPTQIDMFMSQVEMVQDPYAAFDHLSAGTFTTPMARTLANVYPKLYGEMIAAVAMDLDGEKLTFSQKLELSRFMGGVPLEPLMRPEYRQVLLNRGAQTPGQAQAISSPRNNIMSQRIAQQTQTSASRLADR